MKILILTDLRGAFWSSVKYKGAYLDTNIIAAYFTEKGAFVQIRRLADIDFSKDDYFGWFVLYHSTEDPELLYHDFIEDILLGLKNQGAIPVPRFEYFRAHHNKIFMEILRSNSKNPDFCAVRSRVFGTFEEYSDAVNKKELPFPHVVKSGAGSCSANVLKISTTDDIKKVKSIMRHFSPKYMIKEFLKPYFKKTFPSYIPQSACRRKIIVQNFVPYLSGDYKILVFGGKYYVLSRQVRPNDFRASGSGIFSFPDKVNENLLKFTQSVYEYFGVPVISCDIAEKAGKCYLIEFQFVSFGTYTLLKSPYYFCQENGKWIKKDGHSNLETEFARSFWEYLQKQN